jgi:hypothetical protein
MPEVLTVSRKHPEHVKHGHQFMQGFNLRQIGQVSLCRLSAQLAGVDQTGVCGYATSGKDYA